MIKRNIVFHILAQIMLLVCFALIFTPTHAQLKNTTCFYKEDKEERGRVLGSDKYILDSLGNFFKISDWFEGKSTVFLGMYHLDGNIISFDYKSPKDFPPVLRTEEGPAENDSAVKITFLSCLGRPIPKGYQIDAIERVGHFFKAYAVDSAGAIFINPAKYSSLRLTELDHYYGKWVYIDVDQKNKKVVLGLPEEFLQLGHPNVWFEANVSVLLKEDGLYDMAGKKMLYQLQK